MRFINDKSVDMILCDLPYGWGTTKCKWDVIIPFDKLWLEYERIIKDNGAIVLFGSQPFTSLLISSNLNMFKYEIIWEKDKASNFTQAKKRFMKFHENICMFYKKQPIYNPQMVDVGKNWNSFSKNRNNKNDGLFGNSSTAISEYRDTTLRYPRSVIQFNVCRYGDKINENLHPTQKPVRLLEYLIKTYTNENDLVLDNCMGSFTTAVAAINTNRNFIGFEMDKGYYDLGCKRIEDLKLSSELNWLEY